MDMKMSDPEFKALVEKEAERFADTVSTSKEQVAIIGAAMSVVLGTFCVAACTDRKNLTDMVDTVIKSIKLESDIGYEHLKSIGARP